jgi:CubicO group peptidase (beta-lactamase class C family)
MAYFDYVQEQVFAKARMNHSDFLALDGVYDEVAEGYMPITDAQENVVGWKKNIYSTTPEAAADGGATSTAGDLVRFSRALRQGSLLSSPMTVAFLTPKVQQNGQRFRGYTWMYGYGNMFILDDTDQIVRYGHTGEEDGVSCRLYYFPVQNLDVVILSNESWGAGDLAWEIHDLIIDTNP